VNRTPPAIEPLRLEDLPELSRFLIEGFHAVPAGAEFAAPDVLRWKFFEPRGLGDGPRSFVARDEAGRIIGHVGIVPGRFEGQGLTAGPVSTLHMIDWLGARDRRSVGTSLMRRAHQEAATQFVLVANARARRVTGASGYEPVAEVPVFQKVLDPRSQLRASGHGPIGRLLRAARDTARAVAGRGERPRTSVVLRRVEAFDETILPILNDARTRAVLNARTPALLNAYLRYPRPGISGWLVIGEDGTILGLALLNVVRREGIRAGKIVECLLEGDDPDRWHAAIAALTRELKSQGADTITAYGSTPWTAAALHHCGFRARDRLEFTLRDRDRLIPRTSTFHLTPMEADDALS
jgi:hypothetical protein